MSEQSYSTELLIAAAPEAVYQAITEGIDKWWTELANPAVDVGDPLMVGFENTTVWVMTVDEAVPNRLLAWAVTDANHDLDELEKKDEWAGTTIRWEITGQGGESKLTFMHEGLVPALECYDICHAGWNHFLGSLKSYLETGEGYPFVQPVDD